MSAALHIIASVVGAGVAVGAVLTTTRRANQRAPEQAFSDTLPNYTFVGGGAWRGSGGPAMRVSAPLVVLEVFAQGLVVRPARTFLKVVVPRSEFEWADISHIEQRPTGVLIVQSDGCGRTVLFQSRRGQIMQVLSTCPVALR